MLYNLSFVEKIYYLCLHKKRQNINREILLAQFTRDSLWEVELKVIYIYFF